MLSKTLPWCGLKGVLNNHLTLRLVAKSSIRRFPSSCSFRSSFSAPTKDVPLSEMIVVGHPWFAAKRCRAWRNDSAEVLDNFEVDCANCSTGKKSSPRFALLVPAVFDVEEAKQIYTGNWKRWEKIVSACLVVGQPWSWYRDTDEACDK